MKTNEPIPTLALDDLLHMAASAIEDLLEHTDPNTSYYSGVWSDVPGKLRAAAMLQAGNSPVIPDGYVIVPKEPTEDMRDAYYESSVAPISRLSICGYQAMLAAAPQSPGSEPATAPGKWIPVSERTPEEDTDVVVYCSDTEEQFVAYHNCNGYFHYATYEKKGEGYVDIVCNPTHWMPLPAAPQEEKP